jgi:2'-5' RNA ligase
MSNFVVVAIPEEQDRVWKVSSEKIPHLTLLFLGDEDDADTQQIMQFVEHAVTLSQHGQFYANVDHRGTLGDDDADVLFFRKNSWDLKWITQFRNQLLQNHAIRTAYDSTDQYDEWTPHLTLGYPETPAKPQKDDDWPIHSVCFDRIAVWVGDFEGPEFRLEWPDRELEGDLAVAYSDTQKDAIVHCTTNRLDVIEHFGIRGMHWGQRKSETITTRDGKTQQGTKRQAAKADKNWKKDFESGKGFGFDDEKFTKAYNEKWKDHDFSKEDWNNPSPTYKKYEDGYFKEMSHEYSRQYAEHFGSSPTGKMKVSLVEHNGEPHIKLTHNDVVHADGVVVLFKVTFDDKGLITKISQVKDSMAQATDLASEFIEHFGTKGMKWGVQKAKVGAQKVGRGLKKAGIFLADSAWEHSVYSTEKHNIVHNKVASNIDAKVFKLQESPKYRGKNLKADKALETEYHQDVAKITDSAYRGAVKDAYGTNYSGTKSVHYVNDVRGARLEIRDTATGQRKGEVDISKTQEVVTNELDTSASHAATEEAPDISIPLKLDKNGQISGVVFVESKMIHSDDPVDEFLLEHFGIKGMHWGFRKGPPVAVAPTAKSRVPFGSRRKTKIDVEGGENHPAHVDAVKVAEAKIKLKKSGAAALSNQELREVANRMQLENQVALLTSHKGKRFVSRQLEIEGQNLAREAARAGVRAGVKRGAKRLAVAAI